MSIATPSASTLKMPFRSTHDLLRAGPVLHPAVYAHIRRRAVLQGCKWDPQVQDTPTLADFPVIMKRSLWEHLSAIAERLAAECVAAENEIALRPNLIDRLGFPSPLKRLFRQPGAETPAAGRIIRFDFHPTHDGWRISEANSDVPGGFTEGSHFTALVANEFPWLRPAGDPAKSWTTALAASNPQVVVLLSAPGYMEDHQVVSFLAHHLRNRGCRAFLAHPGQISWSNGFAVLQSASYRGVVDVIVRFYQAEWLAALPPATGWANLFRGGHVVVANPVRAILSESKRFPLIWDHLDTGMPTWRQYLPETRDPREIAWNDSSWLLKTAMCNNGDTVSAREWLSRAEWFRIQLAARLHPSAWVVQRRFDSLPISTPHGSLHACVGIYTVNGQAAGAYVRLGRKPLIDYAAMDAALLIEDDD